MNAAAVTQNTRSPATWMVIFGATTRGGEFIVSHAKPSRHYKSEKAANKAAADWRNLP